MKYWYATQFIEKGSWQEFLSIGVVAEDGREFYAVSQSALDENCRPWFRKNILPDLRHKGRHGVYLRDHDLRKAFIEFCDSSRYGEPDFFTYSFADIHPTVAGIFVIRLAAPPDWPTHATNLRLVADSLGITTPGLDDIAENNAMARAKWNKRFYDELLSVVAEAEAILQEKRASMAA